MQLLIGDVFRNAARAVPGRMAAAHGDATFTFGELDARANQVARALAAQGVGHRDRVAVWAASSLDVVVLFAAVAKIGAVFVPVSPSLAPEEAAPTLAAATPALIVADDERRDAADRMGTDLAVPVAGLAAPEGPDGDVPSPPALTESDPHVVFFTSGSTGRPKGVVLSHRVDVLRTHPGALLEPRGTMVCPYPLFHMAAWTIALQQWQARGAVVFCPPDPEAICDAVERHRAGRLNCIPAVWRRVLAHVGEQGRDLSTLRFADTGTSATPVELLRAIAAACPDAWVRVFYGSTEAGSVACLQHDDIERKPGSCGPPAVLTAVRVEGGELWVRGPLVFEGYVDDDGSAWADGWYRTGDLVEVDDEGYLTVVGRVRETIRTGGETVAPSEVEAVLSDEPSVADVAVVGLPDEAWGEVVCAVVVARPGHAAPDVEGLRAHCRGRLAAYKHPRRVAVVDAIPRTAPTGQVQRRLLVERVLSGLPPA